MIKILMIEDDSTIAFGVKYALEQEGIKIDISKEETIYIPQGVEYMIQGDLELIKSYV